MFQVQCSQTSCHISKKVQYYESWEGVSKKFSPSELFLIPKKSTLSKFPSQVSWPSHLTAFNKIKYLILFSFCQISHKLTMVSGTNTKKTHCLNHFFPMTLPYKEEACLTNDGVETIYRTFPFSLEWTFEMFYFIASASSRENESNFYILGDKTSNSILAGS